jgi:hypothetical protein
MAEQASIARTPAQIGLDFYALRKDGIALLQALCGAAWTDYNLHDPGVTILEQLCYALTDLAYRTDFGVADYLAAPDGSIDYQRLALYPPQEILASQALTPNDYRKLVYDAIPRVAEVWLRAAEDGLDGKGLVSLYVMPVQDALADRDPAARNAALVLAVRALYAGNRSLCEDVAEIRTVEASPCFLKGEIEIDGQREAADILAQLIADCADWVSSGISVMRFEDALGADGRLEQLFEGPATRHGYIAVREGDSGRRQVASSELITVIQAVPGVRRVRNLVFIDAQGKEAPALPCDPTSGSFPRLQFPRSETEIELLRLVPPQGIVFGVSERVVPAERAWREKNQLLYADAELAFKKLAFERLAFRNSDGESAARSLPLPAGKYRAFRDYYSIQHQFPGIYGINAAGVPSSAGAQRKVEAQQLKAYLFPFEQLMANYLENIQQLPQLYSSDTAAGQSYFAQYLRNGEIPAIEPLYLADAAMPQADHALPPGHDDYFERKGRALDYLLALYGEEFPQQSLRRFNQYHRASTEQWLLHAKATLLRELADLGARRATAFDYLKLSEYTSNVSRLQRRAGILLGLHHPERERSFSTVLADHELTLVDERSFDSGAHPELAYEEGELAVPGPAGPAEGAAAANDLGLPFRRISASFLRHGCALDNYRLGTRGNLTVVYFNSGTRMRALAAFADRHSAQQAARAYAAALARLNHACEGMHIVEHILLRPRGDSPHRIENFGRGESFFTCRISVVLSGWTLRFSDPEFRNFAEETISQFCPAHIYPAFHWLEADEMQHFEAHHGLWRERLRAYEQQGRSAGAAELDGAAQWLARFLSARIGGKK